jgi:hypothetical protein
MDPKQQRLLIILGSIIAILLIVLIVVLLNEDDGVSVASDSTDTSVSVTTSVGATTTTVAAATTTAATSAPTPTTATPTTATTAVPPPPAGACEGLPSPLQPGPGPDVTSANGDFDGDGNLDQLIGYRDPGGTWWVQMVFSYGYATQTAVFGPVTALGAQDFGGTGQDVGFAFVDHGASTQLVGFFFAPGCDINEATIAGTGSVARFPIGGGVTHLDGMFCTFDGFTTTSATTGDGINWEYTTTDYLWVPALLEFQASASSVSLLTSPANDATIFASAEFDCPLLAP